MVEGGFPKVGNDEMFASEYNSLAFETVYSGNGFDSDADGSSVTSSGTNNFFIDSSRTANVSYAQVNIFVSHLGRCGANSLQSNAVLKIETSESGGTLSDSLGSQVVLRYSTPNDDGADILIGTSQVNWVHPLTVAEQSSGLSVQITSESVTGADAANRMSVINKMTTIKLIN